MKLLVTVAFDGDRDVFATDAVGRLAEVVGSGAASQATLDVRLPDSELEALGSELMTQQEERAVIALWDTDVDTALSMPLPAGSRLVGAYHVEEVVQKDYDRTWPSGTQSPGFKMIAFLHRRADLTQEAFSQHWREHQGRWRWRCSQGSGTTCRITSSSGSLTPHQTGTASARSTTAR